MRIVDIIEKKRNGLQLSKEEIYYFINGYTEDFIPDYQISALLMAIYFQGMTIEESSHLTMAMVESGEQIDLSGIKNIKVDKHSTGGVGDTTTIVLGPLVAAAGVPVAKMSGRGLGHTGGTLDKLEAIEGFEVEITNEQFINLVNKNNIAVIGQSSNLTPADKKLYSLRDVTATVNSIPLIASSIMSKKIASGADAIVLDIKTGSGAFMKTLDEAKQLAEVMVEIGNKVGRKTMGVISNMNEPLGNAIGNSLEIKEAIETLRGEGPEDLTELCLTLGSQMVYLANRADSLDEARLLLEKIITDESALEKMKTFIKAQGGDDSIVDDLNKLPQANYKITVPSIEKGYVSEIITDGVGQAAMLLGAGRTDKETVIDLAVGLVLHKKVGHTVEIGEPLVTIYSNKKDVDQITKKLLQFIKISSKQPKKQPVYYEIIE